jgi:hypothetical protein
MDVQPSPYPEYKVQLSGVADEYRVTIWEQPATPDVDPTQVGWGEITFDLVGVTDVHEAVQRAEQKLAANNEPYSSRSGTPVRDREYVLYRWRCGEGCCRQTA